MTGIERLRAIAGAWDEWGLGGSLTEIADEIERELDRQDEPDSTGNGARLLYVTDEDRNAAAWVRDHGGIDHVKAKWRSRVPRDRYERRRQSLLGHIAECETALGRRNVRIEELGRRVGDLTSENAELRKRLMPEGIEWPRYESGEPVGFGDDVIGRCGDDPIKVRSVEFRDGDIYLREGFKTDRVVIVYPGEPVRRPAVLAADGEPLEVGQTVWDVESGEELKVEKLCDVGLVRLLTRDGVSRYVYPDQLTHTKPEIDTWQRIEEDALNFVEDNAGMPHDQDQMERDMLTILRRCKALAERERGD